MKFDIKVSMGRHGIKQITEDIMERANQAKQLEEQVEQIEKEENRAEAYKQYNSIVTQETDEGKSSELRKLYLIAARMVYEEARNLVPVRTGRLKDEMYITSDGTDVGVVSPTEYAVFVHEVLGNRHAPGKQAKYLEDSGIKVYYEMLERYGIELDVKLEVDGTKVTLWVNSGNEL